MNFRYLPARPPALKTGHGTAGPRVEVMLYEEKRKRDFLLLKFSCAQPLIVASGAQVRTLRSGLVLFLTFDCGARIEGIVTHVLLCETLYRVDYYHF